eukprot:11179808-Lingulodinium_polyedra.AAC.3
MAAEHLHPERVRADGENSLLLGLLPAFDWAVGDLLGALHHAHVVRDSRSAGHVEEAHRALHVAWHVADGHVVDFHAALSRVAHTVEHCLPERVLRDVGDRLGSQAIANDVVRALLQLLCQLRDVLECLAGDVVWCRPIEAHAIAGIALIELQAEWGVDGKHALDVAGLAVCAAFVVRDLTDFFVDGHPLNDAFASGRQRHLALNVAVAILDLACGPIHVDGLPGLLDGRLNGNEHDAIADSRGGSAVHALGLPHEGIHGAQRGRLWHVPLHPEAVSFAPLVELNLQRVGPQGNDALEVGLHAILDLAIHDLTRGLVVANVLRVGDAVGTQRALHKAPAVLDGHVGAIEEAARLADGLQHGAPQAVVRDTRDRWGANTEADDL